MILFLVLGVVGISGCTDNSSQNKTFNKDGITFQYPGNWTENVNVSWTTGNAQNSTIGTMGNGNITLAVLYNNLTNSPVKGFDIGAMKNIAVQSWKSEVNTKILSDTNRQINNKTFYEIIYTTVDPISNITTKSYYVITGDKGQSLYILRFNTPEADFASYYNQFRDIVSSVQF